jgi:hypothetical protein
MQEPARYVRFLCVFLSAVVAAGVGVSAQAGDTDLEVSEDARGVAAFIRGKQVEGRVRLLASNFFEGREAGTRGERLTQRYLADFHYGLGLSPAGDDGSFYQFFSLHQRTLGETNTFHVIHDTAGDGELRTAYSLDDGFRPFVFSPSAQVEAPVVFAGYGISSEERDYDDYASLDVRGSIVLVLRHEPQETDPESKFRGVRSTKHAAFLSKVRLAQSHGAVGLLLVTDPVGHDEDAREPGNRLARWASLVERGEHDLRDAPDPYTYYPEIAPDVSIPALHISYAAAEDLLRGSGRDLEATQRGIDETLEPDSFELAGVAASIRTTIDVEHIEVGNVLARLEGSDPELRDETIIIGGHLDHVGYGHFGTSRDHWDALHPGADDNASGTAAVLSVAEAFARSETPPKRSVVFMHFTAEEKGLLGARWFVDHPTFPLETIVAMFNLDMVGRNEPNILSVVGDRGLDALLKHIGKAELGMTVNNDAGSGIDRSDQWAFARVGVPAIALFSGVHDDYHTPRDRSSKIVTAKLQNVSRMVAMAAWEIGEHGAALVQSPAEEE